MKILETMNATSHPISGFYTKRLSARPLNETDCNEIYKSIQSTGSQYTHYNKNLSQAQLGETIHRRLGQKTTFKDDFFYVLRHRESGVFIGVLSFLDVRGHCVCNVFVEQSRRNNGYAEEVIQGSFTILHMLEVAELYFEVDTENLPGTKVMEALSAVEQKADPVMREHGDGTKGFITEFCLTVT